VDHAILLCGDSEAKADVVKQYIPELNRNVNKYLRELDLMIEVEFDSEFNLTMDDSERRGQSLHSLSAGQKGRLDLSIRLALRNLASNKQSVECNYLLLDEILECFSEDGTLDVCEMLKAKFSNLNLCIISQKNAMMKDIFQDVVCYGLKNEFTTIIEE
jgi:DNA repair exonuclease SbcCD ATPase subunit